MAQYIDKDALVAEIERLRDLLPDAKDCDYLQLEFARGQQDVLTDFEEFIDILEVKEVDFGTEVYKYIEEHFNVYDDGNQTLQTKDKKSLIGRVDVENIATHFFKLGIGVSNKTQKGEKYEILSRNI